MNSLTALARPGEIHPRFERATGKEGKQAFPLQEGGKEVNAMDQDFNIIESWEDDTGQTYAIVRHTDQDQQRYGCKAYEPMWVSDGDDELWSFGGSVGYTTPTFQSLEAARDFLELLQRRETPT
jgi:hypothetical protein